MTKYERTRLLGIRSKQLIDNAKPMLKNILANTNIKEIAIQELNNKVIPLIIERPLPNGKYELWHLSELEI